MNFSISQNKKVLIINRSQFGYHSDTYYYSKLLRKQFVITYVCYDHLKEKIKIDDVNIVYVSAKGNYPMRTFRYFRAIVNELKKHNNDIVFVKYFPGVSLLSFLLNKENTLLDIRSSIVAYSKVKRLIGNWLLRFESRFYRNISVISEGLAQKLRLKGNICIIPLGAEVISDSEKKFNKIELLYVGTFFNRNIEQTIDSVARFVKEINSDITYKIVGFGSTKEEDKIKKRIQENRLQTIVSFEGRVKVNELEKYFNTSNVGVTFIPITDYFNYQPPTKLFEYALSGMVNIATATEINKKYINEKNGIICNDSAEGFFEALCLVQNKLSQYNSKTIKNTLIEYQWDSIVKYKLIPKLIELI